MEAFLEEADFFARGNLVDSSDSNYLDKYLEQLDPILFHFRAVNSRSKLSS